MVDKETVVAWEKRLSDNFSHQDVIGGRILPTIMKMERIVGQHYVETYGGHRRLTDAFLDFFAITLSEVVAIIQKHGWPSDAAHFPECLGAMLVR
jgi:hypothetical protein